MNKTRRKMIETIVTEVKNVSEMILESANKISQLKDRLEDVLSDEEEAYDNMPEGLQVSERGIASEEAIDVLNEACGNGEDVVNGLNEIANNLNDICENLEDICY